jgi:hypothetical protein
MRPSVDLLRRAHLLALLGAAACGHAVVAPGPPPAAVDATGATTAFVDVTIVPMDTEHELPHQTVLVKDDRILAIGPTDRTPIPPSVRRIDGHGKWLLPGLIDMHVHLDDPRDGLLFVANGVTTVRNMWGNPEHLAWRERAANDPSWIAPSIYTAGPILDGAPPTWPGSTVIETAEQAAAEVAAERQAGYDFVKVYSKGRRSPDDG